MQIRYTACTTVCSVHPIKSVVHIEVRLAKSRSSYTQLVAIGKSMRYIFRFVTTTRSAYESQAHSPATHTHSHTHTHVGWPTCILGWSFWFFNSNLEKSKAFKFQPKMRFLKASKNISSLNKNRLSVKKWIWKLVTLLGHTLCECSIKWRLANMYVMYMCVCQRWALEVLAAVPTASEILVPQNCRPHLKQKALSRTATEIWELQTATLVSTTVPQAA